MCVKPVRREDQPLIVKYEDKTDMEFKRLMKYGENAFNTRRLVSAFKDGQLSNLRTEILSVVGVSDINIFRFLRKAAIINSATKIKYAEWVNERLREEQ